MHKNLYGNNAMILEGRLLPPTFLNCKHHKLMKKVGVSLLHINFRKNCQK
jgi:hypothetical protein